MKWFSCLMVLSVCSSWSPLEKALFVSLTFALSGSEVRGRTWWMWWSKLMPKAAEFNTSDCVMLSYYAARWCLRAGLHGMRSRSAPGPPYGVKFKAITAGTLVRNRCLLSVSSSLTSYSRSPSLSSDFSFSSSPFSSFISLPLLNLSISSCILCVTEFGEEFSEKIESTTYEFQALFDKY